MAKARNARCSVIRPIVRVVAQRLLARPARGALVALGVAVATATLLGVVAGGLVAADLGVRASLAGVDEAERVVRVTWRGSAPDNLTAIDRASAQSMASLTAGAPVRSVQFRELNLGGRGVVLAAVDDLDRWVEFEAGSTSPAPCRPERCEVIRILGEGTPVSGVAGANIVAVGTGRLRSTAPFGDLAAARAAQGGFAQTPVLVTGDRAGLSALPGLSFAYRTYAWSAPVATRFTHPWTVDDFLRRQAASGQALIVDDAAFTLTAPERTLVDARDASSRASSRIMLVGGAAAVLVVGFALLAAVALRDEHAEERDRLSRRGASRGAQRLFTIGERGVMSFAGVATGYVAAIAAVVVIARRSAVPPGEVLRQSLLSGEGIAWAVSIWLATSVILVVAQRRSRHGGSRRGLQPVDVAAMGGLFAVALVAARGGADAERLPGTDPFLMVLPLIGAVAAGLVVARLFGPLMRLLERTGRGATTSLRLALVALARRPGRAALTAAFLAVGVGLGVFAQAYRATLERGNADQAAFEVPRALTISGDAGPGTLTGLTLRLPPGTPVEPVVRQAVSVRGSSLPLPATLLGTPSAGLPERWREDYADRGASELARVLEPVSDARLAGLDLPPTATTITVAVDQVRGPEVDLRLLIEDVRGGLEAIPLLRGAGSVASGPIDVAARGGRIVGIEAVLTPAQSINVGHAEGEGRGSDAVVGEVALGSIAAAPGGKVLGAFTGWRERGAMRILADGATVTARYVLGGEERALIQPVQAWAGRPIPVVVSDDLARRAGDSDAIAFTAGGVVLEGRIVGAARRVPTIDGGSFLLADTGQILRARQLADPGSGRPDELWIDVAPGSAAAVERAARSEGLTVADQSSVRNRLASDPLGRGILHTLVAAALISLALGVLALALALSTDARDERREWADLMLQGVRPAVVRSHLRWRGGVIALVGVVGGLALGTGLSLVVVRLVRVAADTRTPVPPLVYAAGWPTIAAAAGVFLLVAGAAIGFVSRRRPARPV